MAKFLEQLADRLDLPAEVVAGVPQVTLTGQTRVLIENHKGILSYTDTEVEVSGGKAVRVRVRGADLLLRAMDSEMLLITGNIIGVDIE